MFDNRKQKYLKYTFCGGFRASSSFSFKQPSLIKSLSALRTSDSKRFAAEIIIFRTSCFKVSFSNLQKRGKTLSFVWTPTDDERQSLIVAVKGSPKYGPRARFGPLSHFIRPQRHFVNNEKTAYLRSICWFARMHCNISRNNHINVRCPALEQLCKNLCGPLAKQFGDPCIVDGAKL